MDRKKLINQIMAECEKDGEPVTREEAAEMADMELKAKKNCRRYEGDKTTRKKPQREKKIDAEKVSIIESVAHQLTRLIEPAAAEKIKIENPQREITFQVGENEYSLTLTRHRKKQGS